MSKKNGRIIGVIAVAAIAVLLSLLAGCAQAEGDSMEDVIGEFTAGINARNLDAIKATLDSTATSYSTADLAFWAENFPQTDYVVGTFTEISDTTASVIFNSVSGASLTYYFQMTDGGDTYYVRMIDDNANLLSPFFQ